MPLSHSFHDAVNYLHLAIGQETGELGGSTREGDGRGLRTDDVKRVLIPSSHLQP